MAIADLVHVELVNDVVGDCPQVIVEVDDLHRSAEAALP